MRLDSMLVAARTGFLAALIGCCASCGGTQSSPTGSSPATSVPDIVIASGQLTVVRGAFIDFDSVTVVPAGSPDADVFFYTDTSAGRTIWGGLLVRNGAELGIFGRDLAPGRAGCSAPGAVGFNANVEVARLPAGTYLCVRTTSNRYSQVRIVTEAGPSAGPTLSLAVETYR